MGNTMVTTKEDDFEKRIQTIERNLQALAARRAAQSTEAVLKRLLPMIKLARKSGASNRDILDILLDQNVKISASELRKALAQVTQERGASKRTPSRKQKAKTPKVSTSQESISHQDLVNFEDFDPGSDHFEHEEPIDHPEEHDEAVSAHDDFDDLILWPLPKETADNTGNASEPHEKGGQK